MPAYEHVRQFKKWLSNESGNGLSQISLYVITWTNI